MTGIIMAIIGFTVLACVLTYIHKTEKQHDEFISALVESQLRMKEFERRVNQHRKSFNN